MKKYLMIFALTMGVAGAASAQVADSSAVVNKNADKELQNASMAIFKIAENIRTRWFEIAAIVAMVTDSTLPGLH